MRTGRQWLFTAIHLFFICIWVILHVQLRQYAFDDAYIHFRVARNLVEIGAPYYNAYDELKVSTSSGWVIFLAMIYWAAKIINTETNFPLLISVINAFISIWGSIVYTKIVEMFTKIQLTFPQKIFLQTTILAIFLPSSIGLMETPFALLTAGMGIYYLLHTNPQGFTFLGIAIYLRLELFVLTLLICIMVLLKKNFRLLQILMYFILGFTPLVFFDLYYFHTLVPHSIIAKSIVYSLPPLSTLIGIFSQSLPGFPIAGDQNLLIKPALFFIIVIMLGWTVFRETAILKKSFYPAVFYFSGISVIGIYTYGHVLLFDWYTPLFMLPIFIAYSSYSHMIDYPRSIIIKAPLFLLFLLSTISILSTIYSVFNKPNAFVLFENNSRVKVYLEVGKIINEDYPDATLLTSEIGGLGYSFNGKIFDAAGLASSEALYFHPMKVPEQRSSSATGAIPPEYVKLVNPDLIVSYDVFAEALLIDDISAQYNIIALPPYHSEDAIYSENKTVWGSKYLRIYIRKSLPVSDKICALSIKTNETPNKACT